MNPRINFWINCALLTIVLVNQCFILADFEPKNCNEAISLLEKTVSLKDRGFNVTLVPNDALVVTGEENITFSDFIAIEKKLKDVCHSDFKLKTVNFFPWGWMKIDANYEGQGSMLQLNMIAYTFEIKGQIKIDLSGMPGASLGTALSGKSTGKKGTDGDPGLPGGAAGSFLVIGKNMRGISNLTIIANGGDGGPGQNGGDGAPGCYEYLNFSETAENCAKFKNFENSPHLRYGGHGGNGGAGGKGGPRGKIIFIDLQNPKELPNIKAIAGAEGTKGKGSIGGSADPIYSYIWNVKFDGEDGTDGFNTVDIKKPDPGLVFQRISDAIIDFKNYYRAKSHNVYKWTLLKILNNNEIMELVNELYDLEKRYLLLQELEKENIFHVYQSIANKVLKYAETLEDDEHLEQRKVVLNFIYTAILSRVANVNAYFRPRLVIDIEHYLTTIQKDIKKLRDVVKEEKRDLVISNINIDYESWLNRKIDEVTYFIRKDIVPQIDNIFRNIDAKIVSLIDEIKKLKEGPVQNNTQQNLTKKREELQKQMNYKWFFNCMTLVGQTLSAFGGPITSSAGEFIKNVAQVAEPIAMVDSVGPPENLSLPNAVSQFGKDNSNIKNTKVDDFNFTVNYVYFQVQTVKNQ